MASSTSDKDCHGQKLPSMAELALVCQVKSAATEAKGDTGVRFPEDLIETLLCNETPIKGKIVNEIFSALDNNRPSIIRSLDTISLRCLAYLLLDSGVEAAQERGLYLLLDRSQPSANYNLIETMSPDLPSTDCLRLARRQLVHVLYRLFADVARGFALRRLAGKLLVELMLEQEDGCGLSPPVQEQDLTRIASIAHLETDAILKFFASVIIQNLHLSGLTTEFPWTPDDTKYRRTFFNYPELSNDDIIKSYTLYMREAEQEMPRDRDVLPGKVQGAERSAHTCYVLQSIHMDSTVLAKGTIFATSTPSSLLFIYAVDDIYGNHFSYIEVPIRSISRPIRSFASRCGGQDTSLRLPLESTKSITTDSRNQVMKGQYLILLSNEDLTGLQKAVDGAGGGVKLNDTETDSTVRRSSSMVIPLDMVEAVVRKSKRTSEARARRKADTNQTLPSSMPPKNMSQVSDTVCPPAVMVPSILSADGPDGKDEGCKFIDEVDGRLLGVIDEEAMECSQIDRFDLIGKPKSSKLHSNPITRNGVSQDARVPPTSPERTSSRPRKDKSSKPTATASQSRQQRSTLSDNRRPNLQLSNTQESLIFHPQRINRKVYTAHSKAVVDWDEDLRPSDEINEPGSDKENEVTSVSSPVFGDSSAFDRNLIDGHKKFGCKTNPTARKRKKPPAKSSHSATRKRGSRSGLISPEACIDNTSNLVECNGGPKKPQVNDIRMENAKGLSDNESMVTGKYTANDGNLNEICANDVSLLRTNEDKQDATAPEIVLDSKDDDGGASYATHISGCRHSRSTIDVQLLGAKGTGRGQNVGEKLTAAFQGETLSQCERHECIRGREVSAYSRKNQKGIGLSFQPSKEHLEITQLPEQGVPEGDEGNDILQGSGRDKTLDIVVRRTAPSKAQETGEEDCQKSVQELEMMTVGMERAVKLSSHDQWKEKDRADKFVSPLSNSAQCQYGELHVQLRDENTPVAQSERNDDSPDSAIERAEGRSYCERVYQSKAELHLAESDIAGSVSSENKGSVFARSPYTCNRRAHGYIAEHPRTTPKRSIVDNNGSPRLLSEGVMKLTASVRAVRCENLSQHLPLRAKKLVGGYTGEESGYDGGLEENSVEEEPSDADSMPAFIACGEESSVRKENSLGSPKDSVIDTQSFRYTGPSSSKASSASTKRTRTYSPLASCESQSAQRDIGRAAPLFHQWYKRIENRGQQPWRSPSQGELASVDSPWDTAVESSTHAKKGVKMSDGDTALQALQRDTQSMLLASSERLMRGLESEKRTVSKMLEMYRQQCDRVLDQLFDAHQERIKLCKQQMDLIQHHHADICQGLIRRLETNERCARKRTKSHLKLDLEERKRKKHRSS